MGKLKAKGPVSLRGKHAWVARGTSGMIHVCSRCPTRRETKMVLNERGRYAGRKVATFFYKDGKGTDLGREMPVCIRAKAEG